MAATRRPSPTRITQRPRRRDARLGGTARSGDDQGARHLCPFAWRRPVVEAADDVDRRRCRTALRRWGARAALRNSPRRRLASSAAKRRRSAAATARSMPRASRSIPSARTARSAPSSGSSWRSRSRSITSLPWLRWDRGPYLPDQAVLIDFPSRRFYFFFIEIWPQEFYYITGLLVLAALGAVPRHLDRRARVVRLYLPADGVDRPDHRGRALLRGRPQRAHAARQGAVVVREAVAQERHASGLAADRGGDRRRLGLLFRRRADACAPARRPATRRSWPTSSSASSPPPPMCSAASPASRSASTCARGRASRAAMIDDDSLLVTYRAWRGEPRGPHKAGAVLGGPGRLHRLPAMRRGLPDRHRHPQRPAARMHPMRAVHRRLRRDHGQGRQAAWAGRLRHRPQSRARRHARSVQSSCFARA